MISAWILILKLLEVCPFDCMTLSGSVKMGVSRPVNNASWMSFGIDFWLLVGTPSAFGPELAYRLRVAQTSLMDVPRFFWYNIILLYMFVYHIFMTSPLWLPVGPVSIRRIIFKKFKCVLLITRLLRLVGRLGSGKPVKHTSWVAIVTPNDRYKSVRNRCVIQVLVKFLCCHVAFFIFLWVEELLS